jgi:hypothetical protein
MGKTSTSGWIRPNLHGSLPKSTPSETVLEAGLYKVIRSTVADSTAERRCKFNNTLFIDSLSNSPETFSEIVIGAVCIALMVILINETSFDYTGNY